jgi:hypothetical protein
VLLPSSVTAQWLLSFLGLVSVILEYLARKSIILLYPSEHKTQQKSQTNFRGLKALNIPFKKMFI